MGSSTVIDFVSHPKRVAAVVERAARMPLMDGMLAIMRDPHFERIGQEALATLNFIQEPGSSEG